MSVASEAINEALTDYFSGRADLATNRCRQIVAADTDCIAAWKLLGLIAYQTSSYNEAIECFGHVLRLNPNDADAHYNRGNAVKCRGRISEALAAYCEAIRLKPDYAEAYNNLGIALDEQGQVEEAIGCYRRAIEIRPDYATALFNLANALQKIGHLGEAAMYHARYLELQPSDADAHYHLGLIFRSEGRPENAIRYFRRALELKPDHAVCHYNLGLALHQQGKDEQAIACYRSAIKLQPANADFHNDLGTALRDFGHLSESIASYQRAVELRPDFAKAISNLGVAYREQHNNVEAVQCFRRAIEIEPASAQIHSNLGLALQDQGEIEASCVHYRRAIELDPSIPELHNNLGTVLEEQKKFSEALTCYDRALQLKPDYPEAHVNRSMLRLLTEDFVNGWKEYEWRLKTKTTPSPDFYRTLWEGQPLTGKTILLCAEQGLGDTIQFVRYASLLKARGATVILECQKPLLKLLSNCRGIDHLVGAGDHRPGFDFHSPLLSLPRIFETDLTHIPAPAPYLSAYSEFVAEWREKLEDLPGFLVAINWRGEAGKPDSERRAIPLHFFGNLAQISGVQLISVQKGVGRDMLASAYGSMSIANLGDDLDTAHGAFIDTAAVMKNVGLVITSDTSVAHLAGALGIPVWVALPFVPNWRWLLDRSDSPWYPTMRLFRQSSPGNWEGVMEEMRDALRNLLK